MERVRYLCGDGGTLNGDATIKKGSWNPCMSQDHVHIICPFFFEIIDTLNEQLKRKVFVTSGWCRKLWGLDERTVGHLNLTSGSSRIASSAYQNWPTKNFHPNPATIKLARALYLFKV